MFCRLQALYPKQMMVQWAQQSGCNLKWHPQRLLKSVAVILELAGVPTNLEIPPCCTSSLYMQEGLTPSNCLVVGYAKVSWQVLDTCAMQTGGVGVGRSTCSYTFSGPVINNYKLAINAQKALE